MLTSASAESWHEACTTFCEFGIGRTFQTSSNVVIVYEDSATWKRAKKGLDYVAQEFGTDFELRHSMWRSDILQDPDPKLSARAAPSLAESDLLMISLREMPTTFIWGTRRANIAAVEKRTCAMRRFFCAQPVRAISHNRYRLLVLSSSNF